MLWWSSISFGTYFTAGPTCCFSGVSYFTVALRDYFPGRCSIFVRWASVLVSLQQSRTLRSTELWHNKKPADLRT
jgi:hypothetical protein